MTARNEKATIIFSRLPIGHETKTRLSPILNDSQRSELHLAMWHDIFTEALRLSGTDIYLYWTGSGEIDSFKSYIPSSFSLVKQAGKNLGERMSFAMRDMFSLGYGRAVIIGSDIPCVRAENIAAAFMALDESDAVIGPSDDGGYWLIGMRKYIPEAFSLSSWGGSDVLGKTIALLNEHGMTCATADSLNDIDTPEDICGFMKREINRESFTYKYLRGIVDAKPKNFDGIII